MKAFNLSKGTIYFPLKNGETVENGKVYEIVAGKAQKVVGTVNGNIIGVCEGGNNMIPKYVMLDIDPTSVFKETYTVKPEIGDYKDVCKLIIAVEEDTKTCFYMLRKEAEGNG